MLRHLPLLALCLFVPCCVRHTASQTVSRTPHAAAKIQPLIDPAKLATLGDRGANPRIQKITAILCEAKAGGQDPAVVAGKAVELIGWGGTEKGRLTAAAMVRNLAILERLGATTLENIAEMKCGQAATVWTGPYAGKVLSVGGGGGEHGAGLFAGDSEIHRRIQAGDCWHQLLVVAEFAHRDLAVFGDDRTGRIFIPQRACKYPLSGCKLAAQSAVHYRKHRHDPSLHEIHAPSDRRLGACAGLGHCAG